MSEAENQDIDLSDVINSYHDMIRQIESDINDPKKLECMTTYYAESQLERIRHYYKLVDQLNQQEQTRIANQFKVSASIRNDIQKSVIKMIDRASEMLKSFLALLTLISTGGIAGIFSVLFRDPSASICEEAASKLYELMWQFGVVLSVVGFVWLYNYVSSIIGSQFMTQLMQKITPNPDNETLEYLVSIFKKAKWLTISSLIVSTLGLGFILYRLGAALIAAYHSIHGCF